MSPDRNVYVTDLAGRRVLVFSGAGKLADGGPKGALTMAKGLAVDKKGRIYVADTLSKIIRVFDQDGNDLAGFGRVADGTDLLQLPVGISVNGSGKIYVADHGSNMVHVWTWK